MRIPSYYRYLLYIMILALLNVHCKKLVEVPPPPTALSGEDAFKNDITAAAVLTGVYSKLSEASVGSYGLSSLSVYPSLSADDLTLIKEFDNGTFTAYYENTLSSSNVAGFDLWTNAYPIIYIVNNAIDRLSKEESTLSEEVRNQLIGESKFLRAFCYFYLVNAYGDVPLVLTTDYTINASLPRAKTDDVYLQIINDLKDAKQLLSEHYLLGDLLQLSIERVRPTRWAAIALLSRAYLFQGKYAEAEIEATEVIQHSTLYDTVPIDQVFNKNNREAIWQLQPVNFGRNTEEALFFTLQPTGPDISHYVYLNPLLVNAFEPGDKRRIVWIDSVMAFGTTFYFPAKYKNVDVNSPVEEYSTVMRLAEQYLIRAEARAQQDDLVNALMDVNLVRSRSRLETISMVDKPGLLTSILHERRAELFCEWGHRWFDLKRTKMIDPIMIEVAPYKGGAWQSTDQFYPIPVSEIQNNPNIKQNDGY